MKKSERPQCSSNLDSDVPYAHPGSFLQHVVEYIMLKEDQTVVPDDAGDSNVRPSGFSEDIGRAVMILMSDLRQKEIYDEIIDIVTFCETDVFSKRVLDFLDNKILNFGHYLTSGDERECLVYFATISELVKCFSKSSAKCMITRVMHEAKENMFMYSDVYESYIHIDAYAKHFLKEHESVTKIIPPEKQK